MKKSCRFYLFEVDKQDFCFDCYTLKVYPVSVHLKDLLQKVDYKSIKKLYGKFYTTVVKQKELESKSHRENICKVTLNFSNKCNLNCSYCFRNKNNTLTMRNEDLNDVFDFVINKYQPNVEGYSFSLCLNSESSLEIEKLKYIDSLVTKYEGRLFNAEDFSLITPKSLFLKLPLEIQRKYLSNENYIEILNEILINENLWDYYDYTTIAYPNELLSITKNLSHSKRTLVNRIILDHVFKEYKIERKTKYIALWFMTNGTNITDEYISFIKSLCLNPVTVSIDGPEEIHNYARKYRDGTGSYNEVIKGIKKLQKNNIDVEASVVITAKYPDLEVIVDYLMTLNVKTISFGLSRGKFNICSFTKESIDVLLKSIDRIYNRIFNELMNNNKSELLSVLKDNIIFTVIKQLYFRLYLSTRCTWGNVLIFDSKGDVYHCDSTIGYKEDCQGNYKEKISTKIQEIPNVNSTKKCKECWAKYFCGGTCHAEKIFKNENNTQMECYFKKELIKRELELYIKLYKHNLLKVFCEQS